MVLMFRGILLVFLVTFFRNIPTLQIIPLILYNSALVYYLIKKVKFEDRKLDIIIKIKETLILFSEFGLFGIYIKVRSENYYNTIGWLIVGLLLLAVGIELIYMLVLQIYDIKEIVKKFIRLYKEICLYVKSIFSPKEAKLREVKFSGVLSAVQSQTISCSQSSILV